MPIKYEALASNPDFALPKLIDEFDGTTFEIENVSFEEGGFGEYAKIGVNGKEYITSSIVLVKQLHEIAKLIEENKDTVEVTMRRVKRYYTF